jgi:hypothetical protein
MEFANSCDMRIFLGSPGSDYEATVFRHVTICRLVEVYQHFKEEHFLYL